jgi:thiol:disulfide interchange protein DsbC
MRCRLSTRGEGPRALGTLLAVVVSFVCAPAAHSGDAEIRAALSKSLTGGAKIEEVRPSPVAGIFEVRINADEIYYVDGSGRYLFQGSLIDTQSKTNLTRERVGQLHPLAHDALAADDAIVTVRGNGTRRLVLFADPNCGYCKRLEAALAELPDVRIQTYLIPILGPDSEAKARRIWCAADRDKVWADWMLRGVEPAAVACPDVSALSRNVAVATRHKISGTPTLFFEDGSRAIGPLTVAEIEARIAQARRQ